MSTGEPGLFVFRQRRPGPPLSEFVEYFWYFHGFTCDFRRERVLPDGSCELIINLQDIPRRRFLGADTTASVSYRRAWLSGTQSGYLEIDVVQNSSLMGVHFKPGGLAPFVAGGAGEVAGQVIEAEALWGNRAIELHDALREATTPELKLERLEAFLILLMAGRCDRHPAVAHALRRFAARPEQLTVRQVTDEIGLSHKQFIAQFRREVGLTPKRFCRILRFQRALDEIESRRVLCWPDLALACGFYDQAHFINEFRHFSGLNPQAYLRDAGEYRNFVPLRT